MEEAINELVSMTQDLECEEFSLSLTSTQNLTVETTQKKLIGMLFTDKDIPPWNLKKIAQGIWKLHHDFFVKRISQKIYLFSFDKIEDRAFVISKVCQ